MHSRSLTVQSFFPTLFLNNVILSNSSSYLLDTPALTASPKEALDSCQCLSMAEALDLLCSMYNSAHLQTVRTMPPCLLGDGLPRFLLPWPWIRQQDSWGACLTFLICVYAPAQTGDCLKQTLYLLYLCQLAQGKAHNRCSINAF